MNQGIRNGFEQVKAFYGQLPKGKRISLSLTLLASLLAFGIIIFFLSSDESKLLASGMSHEEAQSVTRVLKESNIPCRLSSAGDAVYVSEDRLDEARLELASSGIPGNGGVGFELFDKPEIGMTSFQERVNYRRALEGELGRTIRSLSEVRSARVHIVKPRDTLFKEDRQEASASVVLNLASGKNLSRKQIDGIRYLCASAVEGMSPKRVTVLNGQGALLAKADGEEMSGVGSEESMEFQQNLERSLEKRIIQIIEPLVGPGKVVAQVTADVDLRHRMETSEEFNPDRTVLRSEQRSSEERKDDIPKPSGVAGTQSNLPGAAAGKSRTEGQSYSKASETMNYEVDKKVLRTEYPSGKLTRLSVAVVVDGRYEALSTEGADEEKEPAYVARSQEEMDRFEALVRKAVGFDGKRGDQVEVSNIRFTAAGMTPSAPSIIESLPLSSIFRIVGLTVLGLLLFFIVLRPILRSFTSAQTELILQPGKPTTVIEVERSLRRMPIQGPDGQVPEADQLDTKHQLRQLTDANPHRALQVLNSWADGEGDRG